MTRIDTPKASQQFAEAAQQLSDAEEIRSLIDRRLQAIRARDVRHPPPPFPRNMSCLTLSSRCEPRAPCCLKPRRRMVRHFPGPHCLRHS
jgi:hypothetical protein